MILQHSTKCTFLFSEFSSVGYFSLWFNTRQRYLKVSGPDSLNHRNQVNL